MLRVGTWNVEWARATSGRGRAVAGRLASWGCDVLVVTEGEEALLPPGHVVSPTEGWGYGEVADRRKVILWSRHPWEQVDVHVDDALPPGRIATGITQTPLGPVRVVGVCIPWRDAHMRTGDHDRDPWQDHHAYLAALGPFLAALPDDPPPVVAGDFNQRIPRSGQPLDVADALDAAFDGFTIVTGGLTAGGRKVIDHIAVAPSLRADAVEAISRERPAGGRLSDHDGTVVALVRA